jgi:hypothetical protein
MTDETTTLPDPITTPESAPPVTPPSDPVPPTTPAPAKRSRSRRTAGLVGQVVGVIGIVISLLLVVGVIVGRGWLVDQVNAVETSIDATIARAQTPIDNAQATLADLTTRIGEAADAANAVAVDPGATPAALQGVLDRIDGLSQRYLELRQTYANVRGDIVSLLDRLQLLDRLVPGFSIPQGPVDALTTIDEKARALDEGIMQLVDAGTAVGAANAAAQAIADRLTRAEQALEGIGTTLDTVEARVTALRGEIAQTAASIETAITVIAIVLVLLFLYLAFLHLVLFRVGRAQTRAPAAA